MNRHWLRPRATGRISHPPLRALVSLAVCLLLVGDGQAQERDPDGTRMQARRVAPGTTHKDTLSPPSDAADWRYVKLASTADLTIEVSHEPASQRVQVTLTTATGDELTSANSQGGRLKMTRNLDPGIYYISIHAGGAVSYRMAIR